MPNLHPVAVCLLLGSSLASLKGQTASDQLVAEYKKRHREELLAAGQRHVSLGWSIKDSGLIAQATWQFVRAVEVSEGQHPGANTVLNIVRNYEEAFWKKRRKTPARHSQVAYEKRAAAIEREDMKGQLELGRLAAKAKLRDEAISHWQKALLLGARVEAGAKGLLVEGKAAPAELAEWLQAHTSQLADGKARFEPGGSRAPRLTGMREASNDSLVVRTDLPAERAAELLTLGTALAAALAEQLGGAPLRPLQLAVFAQRADYDAYQRALGHGAVRGGAGLCDYGSFQTLVSAEGLEAPDLHALVLHELTHLFFFGTTPVAMPDWYAEGLAESIGAQGSFAFDGKTLRLGGLLRQDRLAALKQEPMPLAEFLAADPMRLLMVDPDKAHRFYAQAWAFRRYLTTPEAPYHERFLAYEAKCRGAMPGAASTVRYGDRQPAIAAFQAEFGHELAALEQAFFLWLKTL